MSGTNFKKKKKDYMHFFKKPSKCGMCYVAKWLLLCQII